MTYLTWILIWIIICLLLVIMGLLIDRTWLTKENKYLNKSKSDVWEWYLESRRQIDTPTIEEINQFIREHKGLREDEKIDLMNRHDRYKNEVDILNYKLEQSHFMNECFLNQITETNDLLDLYIQRDFERVETKKKQN